MGPGRFFDQRMDNLRKQLRLLIQVFATGFILMFYSELVFWARYRPEEDRVLGWLFTWLAYSLLAFLFLSVVHQFHVASLPALFIAGALYGWLAEGVLVQTMYDSFPLQISWTGLAWHSLISVCLGWYLMRRGYHHSKMTQSLGIAVGLGAFWGFWAIFWQLETPEFITKPLDFILFTWFASLLVTLAYWVADRTTSPEGFQPPTWMTIPSIIVLAIYFLMITVPINPLSLAILPVFLILVYIALRRNRAIESNSSLDMTFQGNLPIHRYLPLLAMPLTASLVYTIAISLDLIFPTNWIIYALLTPAGFVLLILSLIVIFRRQSAS